MGACYSYSITLPDPVQLDLYVDICMRSNHSYRNTRMLNFLTAVKALMNLKEVLFLDFNIEEIYQGYGVATMIQIGSWRRNLTGQCFHSDVVSLEGDDDDMQFKSFDDLVEYIKTVIAKQA